MARFASQFCCGVGGAWLPGNALPHGRAVMRLETVAKSNFFDYGRPSRELVALPPATDRSAMNE